MQLREVGRFSDEICVLEDEEESMAVHNLENQESDLFQKLILLTQKSIFIRIPNVWQFYF